MPFTNPQRRGAYHVPGNTLPVYIQLLILPTPWSAYGYGAIL